MQGSTAVVRTCSLPTYIGRVTYTPTFSVDTGSATHAVSIEKTRIYSPARAYPTTDLPDMRVPPAAAVEAVAAPRSSTAPNVQQLFDADDDTQCRT